MSRTESVQQPDIIADRYRCVRLLGRGGFAEVYLAEDLRLDKRPVAIKLLAPHVGRDEGKLRKFRQEAAIIGHLTNPNTVRCYDFGQDRFGRYFIVMEYLPGKTLHRVLKEEKTLDVKRALQIGVQVLDALEEAHQMGIIHRDLKPKNIILVPHRLGERVKVLDFGVARILTPERLEEDDDEWTMVGTATYMSPEQAQGTAVSPASDVYSLGVILFHALTGKPPFVARHDPVALMLHHTSTPVESMLDMELEHKIPYELDKAVLRALEKDPLNRFTQAGHFREVLEDILRREESDVIELESVQLLKGEEEWPTAVALMSQDLESHELPSDSLVEAIAQVRADVSSIENSEDLPSTAHPDSPLSPEDREQVIEEAEETATTDPPSVEAFPRDSVEQDVEDAVVQWLSIAPEELNKLEEEFVEGEDGHTLDTRPRKEKPEELTQPTFSVEYTNFVREKRKELAKTDKQSLAALTEAASASEETPELSPAQEKGVEEAFQEAEEAGSSSDSLDSTVSQVIPLTKSSALFVFDEDSSEPSETPQEEAEEPRPPSENTRERILLDDLLASDPAVENAHTVVDGEGWENEESLAENTRNLQEGSSKNQAPARRDWEGKNPATGTSQSWSQDSLPRHEKAVSEAFAQLTSTQEEDEAWARALEKAGHRSSLLTDTARDSLSIAPSVEAATTLKDEDGYKQKDYAHLAEKTSSSTQSWSEAVAEVTKTNQQALPPQEPPPPHMPPFPSFSAGESTQIEPSIFDVSTDVEEVFDETTSIRPVEEDLDTTDPRLETRLPGGRRPDSAKVSWEQPPPATLRMNQESYKYARRNQGEASMTDELQKVPSASQRKGAPRRHTPIPKPKSPPPPPKPSSSKTTQRGRVIDRTHKHLPWREWLHNVEDLYKQTLEMLRKVPLQRWKWLILGVIVVLAMMIVWLIQR